MHQLVKGLDARNGSLVDFWRGQFSSDDRTTYDGCPCVYINKDPSVWEMRRDSIAGLGDGGARLAREMLD